MTRKREASLEVRILKEIARGVRRFETLRRRTGLSGPQLDGILRRLQEDWMIYVRMVPLRKKTRNPRIIGEARCVLSPRGRKRLDGGHVPTWRKTE